MTALAAFALAGCLAVDPASDRITARDLRPAFPALAALAPDTPLGFAPVAGAQRIFHVAELRRLALRLGIAAVPEAGICVERRTAAPDSVAALRAMRQQLPDARITILELSREPVPSGELEFPPTGLRQTPAGGFWAGWVRYAGGRRFPVWAKVAVSKAGTRVLAAVPLKAGRAIESSELRVEARVDFPRPGVFATTIEEAIGRIPRVSVAAGAEIRLQLLTAPRAVERGETVVVEARAGGALLKMEALAEGGGAVGQTIPVRNPAPERDSLREWKHVARSRW